MDELHPDSEWEDSIKRAADIQACVGRYSERAGMLRKDSTLASLIMRCLATADIRAVGY